MTMQVQIVSPERILWTGEAEMVTARTIEGGDISFQTGHAPFVGAGLLENGDVDEHGRLPGQRWRLLVDRCGSRGRGARLIFKRAPDPLR